MPHLPRELLTAIVYLEAMERGDLDALARLWRMAETDAGLERVFLDLAPSAKQ